MKREELLEKAIYWFRIIAEDMERITSGNLPHNAATTKGRAIRAYEFLEKHKNDEDNNLWKPADGEDLPEINREVIALLSWGKVVFAHRPPEFWDGKDIITGEVTRNFPKTYGKGGWNIPDVKYWLDCSMPKEIEL